MPKGDRNRANFALVDALAKGLQVTDAAEKAGVSKRTVFRRLQDPAFRQQIEELRAQALERAAASLAALGTSAVVALGQLLKAQSESVRLGAARAILELGGKLRETVALEARIAALEADVAGREERDAV